MHGEMTKHLKDAAGVGIARRRGGVQCCTDHLVGGGKGCSLQRPPVRLLCRGLWRGVWLGRCAPTIPGCAGVPKRTIWIRCKVEQLPSPA